MSCITALHIRTHSTSPDTLFVRYSEINEADVILNLTHFSEYVIVEMVRTSLPEGVEVGDVNNNGVVNIVGAQIAYDAACNFYGSNYGNAIPAGFGIWGKRGSLAPYCFRWCILPNENKRKACYVWQ